MSITAADVLAAADPNRLPPVEVCDFIVAHLDAATAEAVVMGLDMLCEYGCVDGDGAWNLLAGLAASCPVAGERLS